MSTDHNPEFASIPPPALSGSDRRTHEALFHHPSSYNLRWQDAVHLHLFETLGTVAEKANNEYLFVTDEANHFMRRPHLKDLTSEEIRELRHFLCPTTPPAS